MHEYLKPPSAIFYIPLEVNKNFESYLSDFFSIGPTIKIHHKEKIIKMLLNNYVQHLINLHKEDLPN
ncbi:hypothetical protein ABSA28_00664 [Candidatus Hepatincolaceae symbiont of Richtersius coronifer]